MAKLNITKILSGHVSEETAYVVDDYPYGFRMRCKIRYWLESNSKGVRFWSQTTNPKKGDVWNKAKASTYALLACMYLDEQSYVQWSSLSEYSSLDAFKGFLEAFRAGLTEADVKRCELYIKAHELYESKKQANSGG